MSSTWSGLVFALCVFQSGCDGTVVGGSLLGASLAAGTTISVATPLSLPAAASDGGSPGEMVTGQALALFVSSLGDSCASAKARRIRSGSALLAVLLYDVDPATGAPSLPSIPATYDVGGTAAAAAAHFAVVNASCGSDAMDTAAATGGSVWLSRLDGATYSGGGNLDFDSGDSITITFDSTENCPAAADLVSGIPTGFDCR